ncbi:MAG: REP-associated tyrosine transposase [Bacteroidota bacterium]|nr:REP-associated tyrosine transposase [Bacteroidota bacterium]
MSKFKNKYRIESNRKPDWNYADNGLYFLTIVTQNRVCNLGRIENNEMLLSDFGKIVLTEWMKSFEIRNELILDEFILMPNHLHAIVEIDNELNKNLVVNPPVETHGRASQNAEMHGVETHGVETHGRASLHEIKRNPPIRLPKSISSFISGFKSSVNSKIDNFIDENNLNIAKYNRNNHFFQPNYHDHIIRNDFEYLAIKDYIKNNPLNWDNDSLL